MAAMMEGERLAAWQALCDALPRAMSPRAVFEAIDRARRSMFGPGLLTVSAYDPERSTLQRLWSSDEAAYPVGGSKHKADSPWTRQVLQRGEVFVGEGDAAIAAAFDDHERIRGLGLHAIVNVPLVWRQRCVGTFNVLRGESRWAQGEVVAVRMLAVGAVQGVVGGG